MDVAANAIEKCRITLKLKCGNTSQKAATRVVDGAAFDPDTIDAMEAIIIITAKIEDKY